MYKRINDKEENREDCSRNKPLALVITEEVGVILLSVPVFYLYWGKLHHFHIYDKRHHAYDERYGKQIKKTWILVF